MMLTSGFQELTLMTNIVANMRITATRTHPQHAKILSFVQVVVCSYSFLNLREDENLEEWSLIYSIGKLVKMGKLRLSTLST